MSKKQMAVWNAIRKPGGAYCVLSDKVHCADIGYVTKVKDLNAHIASFAVRNGIDKVKVHTGRNIMNVDGPSANFTVTFKVE